jgi:hypothetical protein
MGGIKKKRKHGANTIHTEAVTTACIRPMDSTNGSGQWKTRTLAQNVAGYAGDAHHL